MYGKLESRFEVGSDVCLNISYFYLKIFVIFSIALRCMELMMAENSDIISYLGVVGGSGDEGVCLEDI